MLKIDSPRNLTSLIGQMLAYAETDDVPSGEMKYLIGWLENNVDSDPGSLPTPSEISPSRSTF